MPPLRRLDARGRRRAGFVVLPLPQLGGRAGWRGVGFVVGWVVDGLGCLRDARTLPAAGFGSDGWVQGACGMLAPCAALGSALGGRMG